MVLPYLKSLTNSASRFADIGTGYRNYFRPKMLDDVHSLVGSATPQNELKAMYDTGRQSLKIAPNYGVTQSANNIVKANPEVQTYWGDTGAELIDIAAPGSNGIHAYRPNPLPGQSSYFTAVADDLDNLSAMQTLAHEIGHYRMGHSTPTDKVMPDILGGRKNIHAALKEVEAESVAAAVMNRLGYGYSPGVVTRSQGYIAGWNNRLPQELRGVSPEVIDNANTIAAQLIPEPIKRFGPLSKRIANLVV